MDLAEDRPQQPAAADQAVPAEMRPCDVKVGAVDPAGREIVDVLWITRDYAVYRWRKAVDERRFLGRRERQHLVYGISPLFGDRAQRKHFALIGPELARLGALQKGALASRDSINGEVARTIALALEDHMDEAKTTLVGLYERLRTIRTTEDRACYVLFLGLAALAFVLPMLAVHLLGTPDLARPSAQMLHVLGFGALGGFFSVLTKLDRLGVEPEASRGIVFVSAASRILLAVVGAAAVHIFLMSTVGRAVLNAQGIEETGTLCTFAFLAGFSEHFVPGILKTLEWQNGAGGDDAGARPAAVRPARNPAL